MLHYIKNKYGSQSNVYELQWKLYGHLKKQMSAKHRILRDHKCEGINTAYKCQIFEAVSLPLHEALVFCIYTYGCTISKYIGVNNEKDICLPSKESRCGHRSERKNMAVICEMFLKGGKT